MPRIATLVAYLLVGIALGALVFFAIRSRQSSESFSTIGNTLPADTCNSVTYLHQDLVHGSEQLKGSDECSYSYAAPMHILGGVTTIMDAKKGANKFYFCNTPSGSESSRSEDCKGGSKSMQGIVDYINSETTKHVNKKHASVKKLQTTVLQDLKTAFATFKIQFIDQLKNLKALKCQIKKYEDDATKLADRRKAQEKCDSLYGDEWVGVVASETQPFDAFKQIGDNKGCYGLYKKPTKSLINWKALNTHLKAECSEIKDFDHRYSGDDTTNLALQKTEYTCSPRQYSNEKVDDTTWRDYYIDDPHGSLQSDFNPLAAASRRRQ